MLRLSNIPTPPFVKERVLNLRFAYENLEQQFKAVTYDQLYSHFKRLFQQETPSVDQFVDFLEEKYGTEHTGYQQDLDEFLEKRKS